MSIISTAHDALVTRIETVLDTVANGYGRLPNPYVPEDNTEIKLKKGYGLALLAGTNTNRVANCKFSINRTAEVVLTRLYTGADEDAASKATLIKQLFEDQYKIINDLEQDITINGSTMYTRYETDTGIEFVAGDTGRFFMLRSQFSLEYIETFV